MLHKITHAGYNIFAIGKSNTEGNILLAGGVILCRPGDNRQAATG